MLPPAGPLGAASSGVALNKCKAGWNMNPEIEKAVGQNIRRLRERAGMTQDRLSAKMQVEGCDITRSALAKIEVGQRHLYPDEVILIKKLLNVTFDEIFSVDNG